MEQTLKKDNCFTKFRSSYIYDWISQASTDAQV